MLAHFIRETNERILSISITIGILSSIVLGIQLTIYKNIHNRYIQ